MATLSSGVAETADTRFSGELAGGLRARRLGLQGLDIAKVHEATLATMKPIDRSDALTKRAEIFLPVRTGAAAPKIGAKVELNYFLKWAVESRKRAALAFTVSP